MLGGGTIPDETDKALAAFGLVQEVSERKTDQLFKVYDFNWSTLETFCATWPQWKKTVAGSRVIRDAIDWMQVECVMKFMRIRRSDWPLIFEGLQAMQNEALEILNRE